MEIFYQLICSQLPGKSGPVGYNDCRLGEDKEMKFTYQMLRYKFEEHPVVHTLYSNSWGSVTRPWPNSNYSTVTHPVLSHSQIKIFISHDENRIAGFHSSSVTQFFLSSFLKLDNLLWVSVLGNEVFVLHCCWRFAFIQPWKHIRQVCCPIITAHFTLLCE
jgi:hypothetical protein